MILSLCINVKAQQKPILKVLPIDSEIQRALRLEGHKGKVIGIYSFVGADVIFWYVKVTGNQWFIYSESGYLFKARLKKEIKND